MRLNLMEQYIQEHRRVLFKMKINKNKSIAISQILILIIGILAFSYIVGEIGKKSGIEISRGVGIVGAQMGPCEKDADCDEGNVCNLLSGSCEEGIEVGTNTNTGEKIKVPESQAGGENTLNYITQFLGIASTSVSLYQAFTPATPAGEQQ